MSPSMPAAVVKVVGSLSRQCARSSHRVPRCWGTLLMVSDVTAVFSIPVTGCLRGRLETVALDSCHRITCFALSFELVSLQRKVHLSSVGAIRSWPNRCQSIGKIFGIGAMVLAGQASAPWKGPQAPTMRWPKHET